MLLIKQNIGKFKLKSQLIQHKSDPIDQDLKNEVSSFYSEDIELLEDISQNIKMNYDFYKFYILCTSQRAALSKSYATILVKDINNLPYIKCCYEDVVSSFEKILTQSNLLILDGGADEGKQQILSF